MNIYLNGLNKTLKGSNVYRNISNDKGYDPDGVVYHWAVLIYKH
jgi:hypothetical protein